MNSYVGSNPRDLEQQLIKVQQSTGTTFPIFLRFHNWLRMHSRTYYRWHTFHFIRFIHIAVLLIYLAGVAIYSYFLFSASGKVTTTVSVIEPTVTSTVISQPKMVTNVLLNDTWLLPVALMVISGGFIVGVIVGIYRYYNR